jgi:hypothetical protein
VMTVPESRFMHANTADKKTGMSLARNANFTTAVTKVIGEYVAIDLPSLRQTI